MNRFSQRAGQRTTVAAVVVASVAVLYLLPAEPCRAQIPVGPGTLTKTRAVETAPAIAVISFGKPRKQVAYGDYWIYRHAATVQVHHVLKGKLPRRITLSMLYPHNHKDHRYIAFLKRDRGVWTTGYGIPSLWPVLQGSYMWPRDEKMRTLESVSLDAIRKDIQRIMAGAPERERRRGRLRAQARQREQQRRREQAKKRGTISA